jgi:acid phosphatase
MRTTYRRAVPYLFGLAVIAVLASSALAQPAALTNLGDLKATLEAYRSSGQYEADLWAVATEARRYLEERAASGGRLAIVLDIDETSLSNWPAFKVNDLGLIVPGPCDLERGPCGFVSWAQMARAEAIVPTLELYRAARARGVAVFFITGRPESLREATERNLRAAGYAEWARLVLKPDGSRSASAADFKAPVRRSVLEEGYTIILNMGDQPSDLAGGFAERAFLLPNPFYRIP